MYSAETLIAIDKTYKRWANILKLLEEGKPYSASRIIDSIGCPLCQYARGSCIRCPAVREFRFDFSGGCAKLRVFWASYTGACYAETKEDVHKGIRATVRLLWLIDRLWHKVRTQIDAAPMHQSGT